MIVGESGSGVPSVGVIMAKSLQSMGYYLATDREFPSLIKGGKHCQVINFDDEPLWATSAETDIIIAMDKKSMQYYLPRLRDGGVLVHGYERLWGIGDVLEECERRNITVVHLPARTIAYEEGGNELMTNMVMIGMAWRALSLPYAAVAAQVSKKFAKKPKILEIDLRVLERAYAATEKLIDVPQPCAEAVEAEKILVDGNHAIALGAVHAGCRAYFGYPMSPSTGILKHMASMSPRYGVVVKQAEDEITAVQQTLGAMYAGTRSMTATSGGGFDLMTETVSLAGITETPLVIAIAQRPGPGTGLPTWTAQGDLHLCAYSGHGEYARAVLAVSDSEDAFYVIQEAFNLAEELQIPVLVLTEKLIADSYWTVAPYVQGNIPIKRGLVTGDALGELVPSDRYKITESGLSKRWVPTRSEAYYFANGDEHWEDGTLTEEADQAGAMYAKRVRKEQLVIPSAPAPTVYGPAVADISFVGWGSTKCVMRDTIVAAEREGLTVNYLHYTLVYPFDGGAVADFAEGNPNVHLIEGNATGQLGQLAARAGHCDWAGKCLKSDGRPFYLEEMLEYVRAHVPHNPTS